MIFKRTSLQIFILSLINSWWCFSPALAKAHCLQFKTPGVLSVCSQTQFKPISYGNGEGYEGDLIRAISTLWNVKVKFYPQEEFENIWLKASEINSKCDIVAAGMSPLPQRIKQGAVFTIGVAPFKQTLLIRTEDYDSGRIRSYESFKNTNMKIGVAVGTTSKQFAKQRAREINLPETVIVIHPHETELLKALREKKIDAIARGNLGNDYQASLDKNLKVIAPRDFGETMVFSVDAANKPLLEYLNQAIGYLTENGKIGYADWQRNPNVFMQRAKDTVKDQIKPNFCPK